MLEEFQSSFDVVNKRMSSSYTLHCYQGDNKDLAI